MGPALRSNRILGMLALALATGILAIGVLGTAKPVRPEALELGRLVNRHRARMGCRALVWDARLAAVAQRHSEDMARRGYFAHVDPDGDDPFDRLSAAGIDYQAAAENLAYGSTSPRETLKGWLDSRGHRRNLEHCEYTHHGIGFYRNRWTHLFVRYPRRR